VKTGIPLHPARPATPLPALRSVRLLDQVRERIRYLHYSIRTEDAYVHWVKAFIFFHDRRHPGELGGPEVEAFLSWQANERNVAVSTHRQALSALLFLYQKVLGMNLPWMALPPGHRCARDGEHFGVELLHIISPARVVELVRRR